MELYSLSFYRLGSDWSIQYFADKEIANLKKEIVERVDAFCAVFSRFDPDSILSHLNAKRTLEVTDEFMELFSYANNLYVLTDGVFNALASPAHFGYTHSYDEGVFGGPSGELPNYRWEDIYIKGNAITLAPGQLLDFGGVGKGYLVDILVKKMREVSGHFVINGGGDIWVEGGKPDAGPWYVGLELVDDAPISYSIPMITGAIATSGTWRRSWGGHHHLVDSKKNQTPKHIPQTLTVRASSTALGDAAATTLILTPPEKYDDMARKLGVDYGYVIDGVLYASVNMGIMQRNTT